MVYKKSDKTKNDFSIRLESIRKTFPVKKTIRPAGLLKNKKNRLFIFFGIIFLCIIAISLGYLLNGKKNSSKDTAGAAASTTARNIEKPAETFSRVTFFLTSSVKGSLAISSNWEGRYRMTDNGKEVIFKYIGNPGMTADLFSVKIYSREEWDKLPVKDGTVVAEKDNYALVYRKFSDNPYKDQEAEKFIKMLNQSDEIIKTLKLFN